MQSTKLLLIIAFCVVCCLNGFKSYFHRGPMKSIGLTRRNSRMGAISAGKVAPRLSTFFFNGKSGQISTKLRDDAVTLNHSAVCELDKEKPMNKIKALLSALPSIAKKAVDKLKRGKTSSMDAQSSDIGNTAASKGYGIALCVGGDGTVNWIMDETSALVRNASRSKDIRFALIPSGTGNDLFRHIMHLLADRYTPDQLKVLRNKINTLSYKGGAQEALDLFTNNNSVCVPFDRWSLTIDPLDTPEVVEYRRLVKEHGAQKAAALFEEWHKKEKPGVSFSGVPVLTSEVRTFNNYFGMGVDAAVTYQYKVWRDSVKGTPLNWLFHSNNYLSRFFYGAAWVWLSLFAFFPKPLVACRRECDVSVWVPPASLRSKKNGTEINLFSGNLSAVAIPQQPSSSSISSVVMSPFMSLWSLFRTLLKMPSNKQYAGLVLTNIGSFAGGGRLWPQGTSKGGVALQSRSDDGKLELTGLTNWAHLSLVTFKLDNACPLAQEEAYTLINRGRDLPMQVDGEPWIQRQPCKITIRHLNSVKLVLPHLPDAAAPAQDATL